MGFRDRRHAKRAAVPPVPLAAGGSRPHRKPVNFASYLTKQVLLFAMVAFIILIVDFVLYACIAFYEAQCEDNIYWPNTVARYVGDALEQAPDGTWDANGTCTSDLESLDEDSWAMLLDGEGNIVWQWRLPEELDHVYSRDDVMAMAHFNAVDEYPTWMWMRDDGYTLFLGAPKNSYVFYTLQIRDDRIMVYPLYIAGVLLLDALILFAMYAVVKRRAQRSVKPVTDALEKLSKGQAAEVTLGGDLAEIGNRLTDVSRVLERKDSARALWIRGVSHDIRTPLSLVVGQADAISQRADAPDDIRDAASAIREQGMKIAALVSDLNTAAQLDYDAKPVLTERVAIARVVREVCAHHINEGFDEAFPLQCDIDEAVAAAQVIGDDRLLTRAAENLLANARAHNPQGCAITVSVALYDEAHVALRVADTGHGTTPEELAAIRNRIERARSTGTVAAAYGEEHGLGLVLVDRIARAHNGTINFSGSADGFTATLELPLAKS